MDRQPQPSPTEQAEHHRIVAALSSAGFCLPGSIGDESTRCGKARCRCKADPPMLHGPYHHWTRKIDRRSVGRYLSDSQLERYRGWFDETRRLRELLNQLEALSLRIAERTESWEPQAPPARRRAHNRQHTDTTPNRAQQAGQATQARRTTAL